MQFQFVLLRDTPYSPLPADLMAPATTHQQSPLHARKTVVGVEVHDLKNGAVHFWSLPKLRLIAAVAAAAVLLKFIQAFRSQPVPRFSTR